MSLWDIDARIEALIDPETGEIADYEALEALEMERDAKISNTACFIKQLRAEAEAIKTEKLELGKRQSAKENYADRLEEYLAKYLNGMKFEDSRCRISYRKSEQVEVDETKIDELPARFVKIEKKISKQAIKDALKGGQSIEGCRLVEHQNMQIK